MPVSGLPGRQKNIFLSLSIASQTLMKANYLHGHPIEYNIQPSITIEEQNRRAFHLDFTLIQLLMMESPDRVLFLIKNLLCVLFIRDLDLLCNQCKTETLQFFNSFLQIFSLTLVIFFLFKKKIFFFVQFKRKKVLFPSFSLIHARVICNKKKKKKK